MRPVDIRRRPINRADNAVTSRLSKAALLVTALLSMAWAIWLGLPRLGWALPLPWPDQLILHGPLMIGGFLGTLIGLERAVDLAKPSAYLAPLCSASGAIALVFGRHGPAGPLLITIASGLVTMSFIVVPWRQATLSSLTMLTGAFAWLTGNAWWMLGAGVFRVVFFWVAFVVLTIAGERLELARDLQPAPSVRVAFAFAASTLVVGMVLAVYAPATGPRVTGAGLVLIAWWLARHDIAGRSVRQSGLPRFMAVCMLTGYAWLGVAGVLLLATASTTPGSAYDAILHGIFLGFVMSMMFGHAPIALTAITGRPLPYRPAFYAHVALLHASVLMRLTGDLVDVLGRFRVWGGLLNALTILLFIANTARALGAKHAQATVSLL